MQKPIRIAMLLILSITGIWLLADDAVKTAVTAALTLCARSVIPALFPFMVISSLAMSMGLAELLSPPLGGLMAVYGIGSAGSAALVLGLVGGYPTGAVAAAQLYRDGALTRDETEHLLAFCNNANPAFLMGVLGTGLFGNFRAGLWLWVIHIAAALIVGLLLGRTDGKHPPHPRLPPSFRAVSLPAAFVTAVQTALRNSLNVCAFVTVFSVASLPFRNPGGVLSPFLTGMLELFSALPLLPNSPAGFVLAAGLAGWGGLSVLCQTAALTADTDLSLGRCAAGKALQGILSAALAFLCRGFVFGV